MWISGFDLHGFTGEQFVFLLALYIALRLIEAICFVVWDATFGTFDHLTARFWPWLDKKLHWGQSLEERAEKLSDRIESLPELDRKMIDELIDKLYEKHFDRSKGEIE